MRWDFFGLVYEHHGNQANFAPSGPPLGGAAYLLPSGADPSQFSPSFVSLLATDGITPVIGNKYGKGLGNSQKTNFAPGLVSPIKLIPSWWLGAGLVFSTTDLKIAGSRQTSVKTIHSSSISRLPSRNPNTPITFPGCATAGPGGTGTFETGFSCTPLSPTLVNASGLQLRGIQFDYVTPYSMGGNFTIQYQLTNSMSFQLGYVTSLGRHLEVFPNSNNVTALLPATANRATVPAAPGGLPFPDFGANGSYAVTSGSSYYHGLQSKLEKHFASGLNFLATYTWSKVLSDAHDLLNGGSVGNSASNNVNGYRAPAIPGFGIQGDYALAPFDIRNVFHFSGGYELPLARANA